MFNKKRVQYHDHETEFRSCNQNLQLVDVFIHFNIDRDDREVFEFGNTAYKKTYDVEIVRIIAREVLTGFEYIPGKDDLREWKSDIDRVMTKAIHKQTREAV